MSVHWVYLTNHTDTVHLADFNLAANPEIVTTTLCGKRAESMKEGDETLSGVAATCRSCIGHRDRSLHASRQ